MYYTPRLRSFPFFIILVALLIVGSSQVNADTFPYTIEDLGSLPGADHAVPFAVNAQGQVVGWSGLYRAFIFTDGVGIVELFGPAGRPSADARGINDAGIVVGESWGGGMANNAVRWTAGLGEDLGALGPSSRAWDVSPDGIVVGDTPVDALDSDAFAFTDDDGAFLLVPAHYGSHAYDINELGQVAGAMTVGNAYHAYRFTSPADVQDLGVVPGFAGSFGKAINISGQVAGMVTSATGNSQRVFRFTDGVGMVELGGVGETNEVWGMNARGDFVGRGRPSSGIERAFLYTDEGGLRDFSALIDPALRLLYAHDINDAGQIVGLAYDNVAGRWVGVRLTPTTPVGPLAALATTPVRAEAGNTCVGWITISQPAPAGGAVVTLVSADPQTVSVPGSVTITEGERHGSFAAVLNSVTEETPVAVTADYVGQVRSATVTVIPSAPTGIGAGPNGVPLLRVHTLAPNPSSGSTRLEYELSRSSALRVSIYDVTGRLVRNLVDSPQTAGVHPVVWDGRDREGLDVPSGAYFVRIQAGTFRLREKLVLVR